MVKFRICRRTNADLLRIALVITIALVYLDVPLRNSVLLAPQIVAQGAIGSLIIRSFLKNLEISILMLLGPGLMLGGAVALMIFNIAGREIMGIVSLSAIGVIALLRLQESGCWATITSSRLLIFCQVMGLSAISLAWEFPELLPIAVALFLSGFLTRKHLECTRWLAPIVFTAMALIVIVSFLAREEFWWYVTDDYSFFEMLSQHITKSGPFADWGNLNFAKYHWLSYGWSGLLNELSGQPTVFTTLTRTMPFLYSLSLSSSVVFITQRTISSPLTAKTLVPAWVALSINILDWSGTSTAGVYAITAAVLAVAITIVSTSPAFLRRAAVYACFIPVVILTKLGSFFAVLLVLLLTEVSVVARRLTTRVRLMISICALFVGMVGLIPILHYLGKITDGFSLSTVNPGLGLLSTFGFPFTVSALVFWRLYLFALLGLVMAVMSRRRGDYRGQTYSLFLVALSSFSLFGVLLDSIISGDSEGFSYGGSNRFMYFSGPMYFVASISLLAVGALYQTRSIKISRMLSVFVIGLCAAGLIWGRFGLEGVLWQRISFALGNFRDQKVTLLSFVTSDTRIGASVAALLVFFLFCYKKRLLENLLSGLLFAIVILTFSNYSTTSLAAFQTERGAAEVVTNLGPPESKDVGTWLRRNTRSNEIVATNFLFYPNTSQPLVDFSLAIWSEREFLILGPNFTRVFGDITSDVELSMSFGNNPTPIAALALQKQGVRWFIVDRQASSDVSWDFNWDVQYRDKRFLVIKL